MDSRFISVAIGLVVAGCAAHTWAPGPGATADFDTTKARCSIFARQNERGFYAQGSTNFVAGAALGNAIGNSVRAQNDFNDCMLASGWKIADVPPSNLQTSIVQPNPELNVQQRNQEIYSHSYSPTPAQAPITPTWVKSADNRLEFLLPSGWVVMNPPSTISEERRKKIKIMARSQDQQAFFALYISGKKEDIADLRTFVRSKRSGLDELFTNVHVMNETEQDIDGHRYIQYEFTGTSRTSGLTTRHLLTYIALNTLVVSIENWSVVSAYSTHYKLFTDIQTISNVREITNETTAAPQKQGSSLSQS